MRALQPGALRIILLAVRVGDRRALSEPEWERGCWRGRVPYEKVYFLCWSGALALEKAIFAPLNRENCTSRKSLTILLRALLREQCESLFVPIILCIPGEFITPRRKLVQILW
jgi:hypothetical protein